MSGLGIGIGLGIGMSGGPPPKDARGNEILFCPEQNVLLEKSSLWIPNIERELLEYISTAPARLYELSSRKFEELIAAMFANQGFNVELTPPSRDGGFDVLAVQNHPLTGRSTYLVECKRYSPERRVGVGVVRSLLGVVSDQKATKGIVATTAFFTKGARVFEQTNESHLTLRDYNALVAWLRGRHLC